MITRIHVNQHRLRAGEPPLTLRRSTGLQYAQEVRINGPSTLIYRPEQPLSCGAKAWVETTSEVEVVR